MRKNVLACSECGKLLSAERRHLSPHAKTCSMECSIIRERRMDTLAKQRNRERRKKCRTTLK